MLNTLTTNLSILEPSLSNLDRNRGRDIAVQDNTLVEASYTLTLNEKRLLLLGISKIHHDQCPKNLDLIEFSITANEWVGLFPDENPFTTMKRAADRMLTRYVTLHPKLGCTEKIAWFDSVKYYDGEARVRVRFGRSMSLRLAGMLTEFTKVRLLDIRQLSSFHSIRLYEYLSQFRSTGYRTTSIEDFRIAMDCIDKYPAMKELKRAVLKPALNELNAKSDLRVACKDVKRGRTIVGFEFTFFTDKQQDLPL